MLTIDFHPSTRDEALHREAMASLQSNRIDPKFLYVTPRQTELWRQVFLQHSPIHANPEFARIYGEAFRQIPDRLKPGKVLLAGLGCGTGLKELALVSSLKERGHEALFSAIDISHDLVRESAQKLVAAGAGHRRSLVCDLAQTAFLGEWLDALESGLPRLITFFGLIPNFAPSAVTRLFRAILRPGDVLLASAHLVPQPDENWEKLPAAMKLILPQYDNPETLAWLSAGLELWGLENLVEPPEMKVGQVEGIPAFLAFAKWKSNDPFEKWGCLVSPKVEQPLQVFSSLRYTPSLFENLLRREGFDVELLSITSCRQEAIWCVRSG